MRRALIPAALLFAAACQTPTPKDQLTDAVRRAVADSVTAGMQAYVAAVKAAVEHRDPEAAMRFYVNDPDFRFYDGGQAATYADMGRMLPAFFGGLRSIGGGFDSIQVTVLSPTAAVATSPYVDILTDTSGVVTRLHGVVSWTWVRRAEGWRMMHGTAVHLSDSGAPVTIAPSAPK